MHCQIARITFIDGLVLGNLREHFETLAHLTGEEGARTLLNGDPARVASVDFPALAVDLDTPADVAALRSSVS